MNHITKEQSEEIFREVDRSAEYWNIRLHRFANAAIEWYIAQQAASVDATFKKWNAEKAEPKHIENVDSLYTSQERVQKSSEIKQVPLIDDFLIALENEVAREVGNRRALTIGFARAIEAAHGIKASTNKPTLEA